MRRTITWVLVLAVLAGAGALAGAPATTRAQDTNIIWEVEYFDNPYLAGEPVLERRESGTQFYWGGSSPAPNVPADGFSARFATDTFFEAGTYRFYILADDGVKLWIDFPPDKRPEIDTYSTPRPGELLTADVTLSEGMHHIQVDFRENSKDAYLYIAWESLRDGAQGPDFPMPPQTVDWSVQWTAQYFNNINLAGDPVLTRSEPEPGGNWGTSAPGPGIQADNFSARWIIYQDFSGGTYTIEVQADDGVRVSVDGNLVINEWHLATPQQYSATFQLQPGAHTIVVEFYDAGVVAYLDFRMVRQPDSTAPPAQPTGVTATVTAFRLNVRTAPVNGAVLTKIDRNETYPVLGRNNASTWWQINVNGTIGWVSGAWVDLAGNVNSVPVTDGSVVVPTPTPSYGVGQCPGFLPSRLVPGNYGRVVTSPGMPNNLRAQPSLSAALVGQIPAGDAFYIQEGPVCAENTAWYRVYHAGRSGWTAEGQGTTYWLEPIAAQ